MKNRATKLIASIAVLAFVLPGCMHQTTFYHSEATIPYFHKATKTTFKLIKDEEIKSNFGFGVIAATDNDTLSYVLMAPRGAGYSFNRLADANLMYSIPLLSTQVEEFIKILNQSAAVWENKYGDKDGIVYEFRVAPENRIKIESENVVSWYSTFKYYFQNDRNGPLGTVVFGEGEIQYMYQINRLSGIKDLVAMLSMALEG